MAAFTYLQAEEIRDALRRPDTDLEDPSSEFFDAARRKRVGGMVWRVRFCEGALSTSPAAVKRGRARLEDRLVVVGKERARTTGLLEGPGFTGSAEPAPGDRGCPRRPPRPALPRAGASRYAPPALRAGTDAAASPPAPPARAAPSR